MSKTITLRPRLSEKTYAQSERRVYVVDVPKDANKHTIARAVEAQFEVKVETVNIVNIPGKAKRTMSLNGKRYHNAEGKRSDLKKAYVTLAEGNSLPFFAAVEEAEEQEKATQEQVDKAVKKADKADDAKPARRGIRRSTKKEEA